MTGDGRENGDLIGARAAQNIGAQAIEARLFEKRMPAVTHDHYEFVLASPRAAWKLKRVWIAEPDGRVVEQRTFDR